MDNIIANVSSKAATAPMIIYIKLKPFSSVDPSVSVVVISVVVNSVVFATGMEQNN